MGAPERQMESTGQGHQDEYDQLAVAAPISEAPVFTASQSSVRPDSGQSEGGGMGWRPEIQSAKVPAQPSLGRIVLYHHDLYEDCEASAPAIVTAVHEGNLIDITVFYKGQLPYPHSNVPHGEDKGEWSWPPRI